jgi:hypothetical protein
MTAVTTSVIYEQRIDALCFSVTGIAIDASGR